MESQLLSLEWEITKENIGRTKDEILALRESFKEKPDISSVLGLMEKVLNYMVKNEEKIRPPLVKFLLDSKETIKLMLKKEGHSDINIYKQLAYVGIQARYSCLEELKETRQEQVAVSLKEGKDDFIEERNTQINEVMNKMNLFLEKIEELFKRVDQYQLKPEQGVHEPSSQPGKGRPIHMNITIVKVGTRLFGVESEKVVKLFKVPSGLHEKYASQQKIRLKDFEVRLIDLKKIFSIQKGDEKEELKILTVKDKEEHKGLMVDQVLERLAVQSYIGGTYGEHFLGAFPWTYQERPIEIPILALEKL
jgi:chemotaxis protein histidine kinase CheA